MWFEGFELSQINVGDGALRVRRGGSGPPLLLLHGNPQTHAMWHAVAPALARKYSVVCPDLRGYGGSFKPPVTADHGAYAKAAMARDMVELMSRLGHARFFVGAHDRGARVAHRLAIDHPQAIEKLVLLDIVPTIEHFERADMAFGLGYYHWFWFAQPHPFPETLVSAAPEAVIRSALEGIVPESQIFGTRFHYDPHTGEIQSIVRVAAGYGKVAVLEELRHSLQMSGDQVIYVGDGSSDVHVMLHVNRIGGLTIAVSENRYLTPIARRTILSDDGSSVLIPILEEIAGWDGARIRALFGAHGLVVQDWDKSRTDSLTIRGSTAAPLKFA